MTCIEVNFVLSVLSLCPPEEILPVSRFSVTSRKGRRLPVSMVKISLATVTVSVNVRPARGGYNMVYICENTCTPSADTCIRVLCQGRLMP